MTCAWVRVRCCACVRHTLHTHIVRCSKVHGKCAALLPVLGHMFLGGYSKLVAERVAQDNARMFGQSDADFVKSAFHFVAHAFGLRPQLTATQYLDDTRYRWMGWDGWVERRCVCCCLFH